MPAKISFSTQAVREVTCTLPPHSIAEITAGVGIAWMGAYRQSH
ncbi:hypothetical protein [Chitinophaga sp.]